MKRKLLGAAALLAIAAQVLSQERPQDAFSPYVDTLGTISRPTDYRKSWAHLGTYFVIGETQDAHSLHSVYTERRSLDAYEATGEWPDGAVLVKEVMHTAGAELTTGAAQWATEPNVWFVVVKDREERFPGNPLWGDGWGWALFEADAPERQTATDYRSDCLGCHQPAEKTDFIYTQGYPVLGMRHSQRGESAQGTVPVMGSTSKLPEGERVDFASGSAERGVVVFGGSCSLCHTVTSDVRKKGPPLDRIAADGMLPSGKPATPENILRQINQGGEGMPALADRLDDRQKADVIAYLQSPR